MKKTFFLTSGAAVVLLAGCCVEDQNSMICDGTETVTEIVQRTGISDTIFTLDLASLKNVANPSEKPAEAITLSFSPSDKSAAVGKTYRVAGCGGVNRYFGTAEVDGNKMKFSRMGVTMMAGPGLNYEGAYLKTLESVVSYKLDAGTLSLLDKDGKVLLTFK